jgi:rhamnogalacturonan endolyase
MVAVVRLYAVRWATVALWMAGFWLGSGWTWGQTAMADGLGSHTHERIDRGLVARPIEGGRIYLRWRWLHCDPPDRAFEVYRAAAGEAAVKLSQQPITQTTDFVDSTASAGTEYVWSIRSVTGGKQGPIEAEVRAVAGAEVRPYVSIPLDGDHTFQKVGIADLDGNGRYDFVIKQPNANVDPYWRPGYWRPSEGTYKLEAYRGDGTFLWRYDLGWSIEQGIWYSPYVVYDLDGDGRAEVAVKTGEGDPRDADGRVQTGPEYLTILDGQTGTPIAQAPWPSREGFGEELVGYNFASRNQLAVAYLDGKTPSLIALRGTYRRMKAVAYQLREGKLVERWSWDNEGMPRQWQGQGAHWTIAADVTGDGRDELVLGSCVLRGDGTPLWTTGLGHPDHVYVGDIDPLRPGLEIYYGIETRRDNNGMCLVDAATGEILWGLDFPTRHVHSHGMVSDIDPRHAGSECYSGDTDAEKKFAFGLLHNARGEVISREDLFGFGPRTVYWDADPLRELIGRNRVFKYGQSSDDPLLEIEGRLIAVVDLWGDWREEIITTLPGEMRIYTTTIPAEDRRECLMQDRLYRLQVVAAAMGYYQVPTTSYDLRSRSPQ